MSVPAGASQLRINDSELRRRYADYRRRQARALLSIIPREGVRPLYRRALRCDGEGATAPKASDSLEALLVTCEEILPLPPFDVWMEDLGQYPLAHLVELDQSAEAPTAEVPVTLAARSIHARCRPWKARLVAFRDGCVWRGFIDFQSLPEGAPPLRSRTALVFREASPSELRSSFLAFTDAALAAFLRSTLP